MRLGDFGLNLSLFWFAFIHPERRRLSLELKGERIGEILTPEKMEEEEDEVIIEDLQGDEVSSLLL